MKPPPTAPADLRPTRRDALSLGTAALAAAVVGLGAGAARAVTYGVPVAFQRGTVVDMARTLAQAPYQPPSTELPAVVRDLSYVQYRAIWYKPDEAIWKRSGLPFLMELFHRGMFFKEPVEIAVVEDGAARRIVYSPDLFAHGPEVAGPLPAEDIGFSGLRLSAPINRPDEFSEFVVFQGASYLRAIAKDEVYGLSARGLCINTADPKGEEFPSFRRFFVERPAKDANAVTVHAVLDSPSCTGAYTFTIRPGSPTTMDVETVLFARKDIPNVGLAPGTSMFMFNGNGRAGVDDYRPEVHDSDGLLMHNGRGERLWRPLNNPRDLQISAFSDSAPRGFGLMQRNRDFDSYQDGEAAYERRPGLWIEPVGDWGPGAVTLIEIPTDSEIHDNIVAYWKPRDPIRAGSEYRYAYRMSWGADPFPGDGAVVISATRRGRGSIEKPTPQRLFVIDFATPKPSARQAAGGPPGPLPKGEVVSNAGKITGVTVMRGRLPHSWRLAFRLDPDNAKLVELRAGLTFEDGRPAETWMYRWTGD